MTLGRTSFGHLADGTAIESLRLAGDGIEVRILTHGATLQALLVPDRDGIMADIVPGHDEIAPYERTRRFFGATIGRVANRIAGARLGLDGQPVSLTANEGGTALHGGVEGFDRHVWAVTVPDSPPHPAVTLHRTSPDGESGPGTLRTDVTYAIPVPGMLSIAFSASTDRATVVSLTNHSRFNLDGALTGDDVLGHRLTVVADRFLAVDDAGIPLPGPPVPPVPPVPVEGTPFDFRRATAIGARIRAPHDQLRIVRGHDHNYRLAGDPGLRLAARVEAPRSRRTMELRTDRPGPQVYSGDHLDGAAVGKGGRSYRQSDGLCLEPQDWPDAPNRPDYPSVPLHPGDTRTHRSTYSFSAA